MKHIAQVNLAPQGGFTGFGPLGTPEGSGISTFSTFISNTVGIMSIVSIVWFVFLFMTGAIGIMSASGDKQALETNKKKISNGVVGLVIVLIATFVIDLVGYLLGLNSGVFGILNINNLFLRITDGGGLGGATNPR